MEKLRQIMRELVEIERGLHSFSTLLDNLEEVYNSRHDENQKENIWVLKIIVESISQNLSDKITEIDQFIIDNRSK
ncbi:MAG: hypothetical protein IJX86_12025 [Lachnospiraceae bacterium]|nr:hypothetical protein [Lachnospiraceae bacterium]